MQNHLSVWLLLSLLLLLTSCKDEPNQVEIAKSRSNQLVNVKVVTPAGDPIPQFDRLEMPAFFNLATIGESDKDLTAIVLGPRLAKAKRVEVKPLALFSFVQDTTMKAFLVSVPYNSTNVELGRNHLTFMSQNDDLSAAIENWFQAQCGLSNCKNYKWANPYKTILELKSKQ